MSAKKDPLRQPASTSQGAQSTQTAGSEYLLYTTSRTSRQAKKSREQKLKLVSVLFCTMFFVMLGTACWLWPVVIPYVLAPFAVAGAWKFCRVAYIWMVTDPFYEEEQPW